MRKSHLIVALALVATAAGAAPLTYELPPETAKLKRGKGVEVAEANCLSCHSAEYVLTQPPGKGAGFWDAEVQKMIKVFHAPITEADAKAIAEYLAQTY